MSYHNKNTEQLLAVLFSTFFFFFLNQFSLHKEVYILCVNAEVFLNCDDFLWVFLCKRTPQYRSCRKLAQDLLVIKFQPRFYGQSNRVNFSNVSNSWKRSLVAAQTWDPQQLSEETLRNSLLARMQPGRKLITQC